MARLSFKTSTAVSIVSISPLGRRCGRTNPNKRCSRTEAPLLARMEYCMLSRPWGIPSHSGAPAEDCTPITLVTAACCGSTLTWKWGFTLGLWWQILQGVCRLSQGSGPFQRHRTASWCTSSVQLWESLARWVGSSADVAAPLSDTRRHRFVVALRWFSFNGRAWPFPAFWGPLSVCASLCQHFVGTRCQRNTPTVCKRSMQ
mmetsp:Transcript_38910/g.103393  ORF Transcript_38910/g.103393 Transcript_38910/m.103393 type:complete len:202 (-) Transcript_38910:428-1033(-)